MKYVELFAAMDFVTILLDCCRSEGFALSWDRAMNLAALIDSARRDEPRFRESTRKADKEDVQALLRLYVRLHNHYKDKMAHAKDHAREFGPGKWDRKVADQLAEFVTVLRDCLHDDDEAATR